MARQTAEQIFRGLLRGPATTKAVSATNQHAGVTTLSSGSATVVISTTVVNSDSIILHAPLGNANLGSGVALRSTEVKTISSGGYFTLGTNDGVAHPRDTKIMWMIFKT